MKSIAALVLVLLVAAASGVVTDHYSNPNNVVAVLAASSPAHRLQAWFVTDLGLVLVSTQTPTIYSNKTYLWPEAFEAISENSVRLGDAVSPAFDDNGNLYFQVALVFDEIPEEWVLPFQTKTAKPIETNTVPEIIAARRVNKFVGPTDDEATYAIAKITVDPGHGGSDAGAVAQGYQEKFFNLDVGLRFRDLLLGDAGRWSVQITRSTDVAVSLSARTQMANAWPANRFLSIHTNSYSGTSAQGTECYCHSSAPSTACAMRDIVQSEMIKAWGLSNRGSKTADFQVLRDTSMPATLSEMGFITSPVDIKKLADATARQQMAAAHLYAVRRHYGV